jgi:hypothetical protein
MNVELYDKMRWDVKREMHEDEEIRSVAKKRIQATTLDYLCLAQQTQSRPKEHKKKGTIMMKNAYADCRM